MALLRQVFFDVKVYENQLIYAAFNRYLTAL
jgi:hypothetical protein